MILGIIPARYESSRLPGKPLMDICGETMLQRVYKSAKKSKFLDRVIIATDDQRIVDAAISFGAETVMTSSSLQSGSDRIAVAAESYPNAEIIVNIQGDEPFIPAQMIDDSLQPLLFDASSQVSSLMKRITDINDLTSANVVKVVCDARNFALYFSRSPIPYHRDQTSLNNSIKEVSYFKHIGLYAFRREYLFYFTKLNFGFLERMEKLEQLRMLENNIKIRMVETDLESISVDTKEDLVRARNYFNNFSGKNKND